MRQPEESFYKATFKKVVFLIEEYYKRLAAKHGVAIGNTAPTVKDVKSMRELKSMQQGG